METTGTILVLHKPGFSREEAYEPTTVSLWFNLVQLGEQRSSQPLATDMESYLVFTLLRYMRRPELFSTILGMEYLRSSTEYSGRKREEALNNVGDVSLLLAGLYPEYHKRLMVSRDYFHDMGRVAFFDLADLSEYARQHSKAKLFRQIGNTFRSLANVLCAMREENVFAW